MKNILILVIAFFAFTSQAQFKSNKFTTNANPQLVAWTNNVKIESSNFQGNGAGLTGVNAASATNIVGTLTPLMFGAVMDGVTDDWQAYSNTIVAANLRTNGAIVDLLGNVMMITKSPEPIRRPGVTVRNGRIEYPGTNNFFAVGATSANAPGELKIEGLKIIRTSSARPDTNCVGINLATDFPAVDSIYWINANIERCHVVGFHRNIVTGGNCQTRIVNNQLLLAWSNAIYQVALQVQPDMLEIAYNLMHQDDQASIYPGLTDFQRTNVILIQLESGNVGLQIHANNAGGAKQFIKTSQGRAYRYNITDNEVQAMYTTDTNITPVELWNPSYLHLDNNAVSASVGSFNSSNYVAEWGIYATNGSHLNFARSVIGKQPSVRYDVWSENALVDGYQYPRFVGAGTVRTHLTWRDTGIVKTFTDVLYPAMTGWGQGTNQYIDVQDKLTIGNNAIVHTVSGNSLAINSLTTFNSLLVFQTALSDALWDNGGNSSLVLNANYTGVMDFQTGGTSRGVLYAGGWGFKVPVLATNGVASYSEVAGVSIAAGGWTNIWTTNNATVYVTATAVAWTIKNRAGSTIYTSPTLTATVPVTLQPGWSVNAASGLVGTALPW